MLPPVRVLGIGSPFGLDRIGLDLIAALQHRQKLQPYLSKHLLLEPLDRPGANLLRYLESAEYVLLLDAVVDNILAAGETRRYSLAEIQAVGLLQSSHGFGVQQAMGLAGALGQLPQQIELLGISIASVDDFGVSRAEEYIDWAGIMLGLAASLETEIGLICDRIVNQSVTS